MDSALPPKRLRPSTRPEHQDPASHTAQKKRRKQTNKQTKAINRTLVQMVKANLCRKNHRKKHTHTHSQKEKKEEKKKIYIYIRKRVTKPIKKSTNDNKH